MLSFCLLSLKICISEKKHGIFIKLFENMFFHCSFRRNYESVENYNITVPETGSFFGETRTHQKINHIWTSALLGEVQETKPSEGARTIK